MKYEWTEGRQGRLRELLENGMSFSGVAKELDCSRNAAIGKAHRLGISVRPRPNNPNSTSGQPRKRENCVSVVAAPIKAAPILRGEVPFLDLQSHHCRYALDDGLFCGKPKERKSYCAYHANLCYVPWQRSS